VTIGLIYLGARYTIESLINIAGALGLATAVVSATILALGTSLPEVVISVRAAWRKKYELALGNVFGSNLFNILIVAGIPALFMPLAVDQKILLVAIPVMVIATVLYTISGISRRLHNWEGALYLLIYIAFVAKLYGLF
jgi:cation:H+ antiporter